MKTHKPNAELVWKQFTDFLIPHFKLSIAERAVYSHLVRHSRLEGKLRIRFSIAWLAGGTGLTTTPVRRTVRRLSRDGILKLLERSKKGHLILVRLPSEVRRANGTAKGPEVAPSPTPLTGRRSARPATTESISARAVPNSRSALRAAVYLRDRNRCFYCLRRLRPRTRCLDHVVPYVNGGKDTASNLVSACVECNSVKRDSSASDHLRHLYREQRLTSSELAARLRALRSLTAGQLRPVSSHPDHHRL